MAKEIPVYLFVGFLESGKTKFIQETFEDPNFDSGDKTLLLIITSACGIAGGEFADLQVTLLQSAMFVAGIVTLVQLFTIGPVGGAVPIIMGTSSGFIGVFNSVVGTMGGGVLAYGAIMGAVSSEPSLRLMCRRER